MDAWNPTQYKKFENERAQPFWDLAALVTDPGRAGRWLDIGCGSGELTRELHVRRHGRYTLGIDSSAKMLAAAPQDTGLSFQQARIEEFSPSEPFDVVFSNAALQWCDSHRELFPRVISWIAPGGQLAVQMPMNFDHPSHRAADTVARRMGLKVREWPLLTPEEYSVLLWQNGLRDLQVFLKVYLHPMPSAREVIEWTKGTLLTFYERQLDAARFAEFVAEYSATFLRDAGDGPYLYPFKRLLMCGRKS